MTAGLPELTVAAGILRRPDGTVLIAQRPAGKHEEGAWEFPGGKLEPGEDSRTALCRELHEELGIHAEPNQLLHTLTHAYSDRIVTLDFWLVDEWTGEPAGHDGQALRWEYPDRLMAAGLLPADEPVVDLLQEAQGS